MTLFVNSFNYTVNSTKVRDFWTNYVQRVHSPCSEVIRHTSAIQIRLLLLFLLSIQQPCSIARTPRDVTV